MKDKELTPAQTKALAALLSERTITAAAKASGSGESTLRRWLEQDTFKTAFNNAKRDLVEFAVTGLQRAGEQAVATLVRNLTCGSPSSEIAAARVIIDHCVASIGTLELEEKINEIETALRSIAQGGKNNHAIR